MDKTVEEKSKIISFFENKVGGLFKNLFKSNDGVLKQHYADTIIRNCFGEILLLQRSYNDDFKPGVWCLPGGKVEPDEHFINAAPREVQEETGLEVACNIVDTIEKDDCVIHYFEARLKNENDFILLDNEEHFRYEWVPCDKLERYDLIFDLYDILKYLLPYLSVIENIHILPQTPEEEICNSPEAVIKSFDAGLISDNDFLIYNQINSAINNLTKAYELGQITPEQYSNAIEKSKHYEFVKVNRDGKTFLQYREVGSDTTEEDLSTGDTLDTGSLGLKITKYSDKSFLITGDTYKNLELLRQIKSDVGLGSWNKTLGGWVYPANGKDKIMSALISKMPDGTYEETIQKESAIELKNSIEIGTPVSVDEHETKINSITTNENGEVEYEVSNGDSFIDKTEEEIGIPVAIDEKAEELINNANEENRVQTGKELFGKEQGEKSISVKIEEGSKKDDKPTVIEITTRSGEVVNALNYSHVKQMDIQLVNQEDILDSPKPYWCPDINEATFAGYKDKDFVFDYVQLEGEKILLATNGFEKGGWNRKISDHVITNDDLRNNLLAKKYTKSELKNANTWGTPENGYSIKIGEDVFNYTNDQKDNWWADKDSLLNNHECNYAVVTLDQLVATQDYYQKKRKAEIARKKDEDTEKALSRVLTYDEAKMKMYYPFDYEKRLSEKQKKKYTKDQWEALSKEEKVKEIPFMKYPAIQLPSGHRISQLDDNHMMNSNFEMYKKFVNHDYRTPKDKGTRSYEHLDPCAVEYREVREALQWRKIDLKMQREENDGSYDKALQTSYGDTNLNSELLESHGVKIKLQNGKEIKANHTEQIKESLDQVYNSFGNRSSMAKEFGLKISHSGEKLMFARKALGIYYPSMKAIGVSDKSDYGKFGFTLAHEFSHFIDNYSGNKQGRHYASDNPYSTAGQIAGLFRKNMNKSSDSDYINRSCECFARAFEQYHAMKNIGDDAVKYQNVGLPYHQDDNHVSKEKFNTIIKPLIEQFLSENDHILKSSLNELNILDGDVLIKSTKANIGDIHQWSDGKKYQKTNDGWKLLTEQQNKISDWLSEENLKEAKGKTRDEIFELFGNNLEPIATIHSDYLKYLNEDLKDNSVYSGKGYFIDHAVNVHPELTKTDFLKIQDVLNHPDEVKLDNRKPERISLIFIKKYDKYNQEVVSVNEEENKLVVHKTFMTNKKPPQKNLSNVEVKKSLMEGTPIISPTNESFIAAVHPKFFSGLNDNVKLNNFIEPTNLINIPEILEGFQLIKSQFDLGLIEEDIYLDYALKYNEIIKGDPSHGGKLVKKSIIDKKGHRTTEWVKANQDIKKDKSKQQDNEPVSHSTSVLAAFAKETPEAELKKIINTSHDEKLRIAAHLELDRRGKKEKVQNDKKDSGKENSPSISSKNKPNKELKDTKVTLYHGSNAKFDEFDDSKKGSGEGSDLFGAGYYLTDNKKVADFYGHESAKKQHIEKYTHDGIFGTPQPVYKKDADEKAAQEKQVNEFEFNGKLLDAKTFKIDDELKNKIIEICSKYDPSNDADYTKQTVERAIKFAREKKENIRNYRGELLYLISQVSFMDKKITDDIVSAVKDAGYDGIKYPSDKDFEGVANSNNYFVFNKSAINNKSK